MFHWLVRDILHISRAARVIIDVLYSHSPILGIKHLATGFLFSRGYLVMGVSMSGLIDEGGCLVGCHSDVFLITSPAF